MAFDFVTSRQGKPHVTAEQAGALNLSIFGKGRFVTDYADELAVTMASANQVNIATGGLIVDGRFLINEKPETVAIANGTQNQWRKDLIILKINVDASTGIGSVSLSSIQGTPAATEAAAKDPVFTPGDLSKGGHQAQVAIARVTLDGLKPSVALIPPKAYTLGGNDFDILSCEKPAYSDGSKIFWRAFGNKQMVTVQVQVFIGDTSSWASIKCPFVIPQGYRFRGCLDRIKATAGDDGTSALDGDRLIMPVAMRDNDNTNVHLIVKSGGEIYVQNMGGGGHTNGWRYGCLSYTVQD